MQLLRGWRCWPAGTSRPPLVGRKRRKRAAARRARKPAPPFTARRAWRGHRRRRLARRPTRPRACPAYCEVSGTLQPVARLQHRRRLPPARQLERQGLRHRRRRLDRQRRPAGRERGAEEGLRHDADRRRPSDRPASGTMRGRSIPKGEGLQLPRDPRDDGGRQDAGRRLLRPQVRQRVSTSAARPAGAWG